MDEALYLRILSELAEIQYRGIVNFNRYNEPLSDRVVLDRLRQARALLPKAVLQTYTNGDYLTRGYLEELHAAGLDRIFIMTYLGDQDEFSDTDILSRMTAKAMQLGLRCQFTTAVHGVRYTAKLLHDTMKIRLDARNFAAVGTDRGKLIQLAPYVRTSWCAIVFEEVYIDWNGKVVPCCNIRSDAPEHERYVVDDLSGGRSIFEAYASSFLVEWRRSLFNYDPKRKPCDSCRHEVPVDNTESRRLIEKLVKVYVRPM